VSTPGTFWRRPEIAESFTRDRRHLIPLIEGQEEVVRRVITRGERRVGRFLDLGAGGGAFAELVLQTHPAATGVLVDFSEPMIAAAEQRLAPYAGRWQYVLADLSDASWLETLTAGRHDAVVSGFCIHHLPDERKRELYGEAYDLLEPGGLFLNWEHVEACGLGDGMLEEWMVEKLLAAERARPDPRPDEEVLRHYFDAAEADILASPQDQCAWLREAGFVDVDVFFQMPEIAIFGGMKSGRLKADAQDFRCGEAADIQGG
jgi:tRNA (cmo5U34)-methyltransferase